MNTSGKSIYFQPVNGKDEKLNREKKVCDQSSWGCYTDLKSICLSLVDSVSVFFLLFFLFVGSTDNENYIFIFIH